jgi:hypothetical protein
MSWFLLLACALVGAFTPNTGANEGDPTVSAKAEALMVGDYLSYFNLPTRVCDDVSGNCYVKPSYTIMNKLLAYIKGATPGSEIRGHITYISLPEITNALKDAHKYRGVQVYLVQNGEPSPEGDELEAYFGTRHKYCGAVIDGVAVTSCVSAIPFATHHIKNWMFSNTVVDGVTRTYSVWVTSYNLTNGSNKEFNDVFIVNDNYELYAASVKSFASFYGQHRSNDFYNVAGRGHHVIASANTEISYAPQTRSPGSTTEGEEPYGLTNDHVAMALARIDGYEPGCSLQVANLSIAGSRSAIIQKLRDVKDLGCRVQVVASDFYGDAMSELVDGGVEVRHANGPNYVTVHSKMMLYKGVYDGTLGRTLVWGGSHNWTQASLRLRDEVFVAISRLGIYNSYHDYFTWIWARSSPVE